VALGAAAAKIAGLEISFIEIAVREELQAIGIRSGLLEKNVELAHTACDITKDRLSQTVAEAHKDFPVTPAAIVTPTYQGGWLGTAFVAATQNTPLRKTRDWRVVRPVIDFTRCSGCSICFVDCPDGAITLGHGNIPKIDYSVCKGCMVCAEECPIHVIESAREGAPS
jgi:pyruvate ferredoxin oxidoreductase gamma subunit